MDAYTGFAYVYDEYMDNIPYEEWGQYMIALLKENGVSGDSSVLELGCGTGTVTRMLAKEGYDCVGLDMSEDMLSIASEKTFEEGIYADLSINKKITQLYTLLYQRLCITL